MLPGIQEYQVQSWALLQQGKQPGLTHQEVTHANYSVTQTLTRIYLREVCRGLCEQVIKQSPIRQANENKILLTHQIGNY